MFWKIEKLICFIQTWTFVAISGVASEQEPVEILYASYKDIKSYTRNSNGTTNKFTIYESESSRPCGVSMDFRNKLVYWTDDTLSSIYRASMNERNVPETFVDAGLVEPTGIAFDWITGNVYIAENALSLIVACNNVSKLCSVVLQRSKNTRPFDIAVHSNISVMYWTEAGIKPVIMRAGMDGSAPEIVVFEDLNHPKGIAIDLEESKLYWADNGRHGIEFSNLDGSDRIRVGVRDTYMPGYVDVSGNRLYWSYYHQYARAIKGADKLNGSNEESLVYELINFKGFVVADFHRQPVLRSNPCREAGCSHICTLSPELPFRCFCANGMKLKKDGFNCLVQNEFEEVADDLINSSNGTGSRNPNYGQVGSKSNSTNDRNIPAYVIGAVLFFLMVGLLLYFNVRLRRNKNMLSEMELNEFREGLPVSKNLDCTESHIFSEKYDQDKFEIGKFEFCKENSVIIGQGNFGLVYKSHLSRFNGEVAVKVPKSRSKKELSNMCRSTLSEIKVMCYVGKHPNVVSLLGALTTDVNETGVLIIMELCENGSLLKHLREISTRAESDRLEYELTQFCLQLATGMEYLAKKRVIHGDVSARNVLLDKNMTCKISDFGLSRKLEKYATYIKKSNEPLPWAWLSPESLSRMEFTLKSDIWSVGITICEIFSLGIPPYLGETFNLEFVEKLQNGFRLTKPKLASVQIFSKVQECWNLQPEARPEATELMLFFQSQLDNIYGTQFIQLE